MIWLIIPLAIVCIGSLFAGVLLYAVDHDEWRPALSLTMIALISAVLLLLMGLQ